MQNSKLFPGFFFQNIDFFYQTQGYQISDWYKPRQTQKPSLNSYDAVQTLSNHSEMRRVLKLLILLLDGLATD